MSDQPETNAAPEGVEAQSAHLSKLAAQNGPRASSLDLLLDMDEPEELAIALHKATQEKGERWAIVAYHANEMIEAYKRANEPKKAG